MKLRLLSLLALPLIAASLSAPLPSRGAEDLGPRCNELAAHWQRRFTHENLNVLVASPFVIAGDVPHEQLVRYRDELLFPASRALQAEFFDTAPSVPVLTVIVGENGRYRRLARRWFDNDDTEDVGYYAANDRESSIILDSSSGDGTLAHELTHALIDPDFPDVPDWFNEGLASLFEDYSLAGGKIRGLGRARLPELQDAIGGQRLRSLAELIGDRDFYRTDLPDIQDFNYAQARFLMYWLQEKGLLARYYKQFRDHSTEDPTGIDSLREVLRPRSVDQFDQEWRDWVMNLRDSRPHGRRSAQLPSARRGPLAGLFRLGHLDQVFDLAMGLGSAPDPTQRAHERALRAMTQSRLNLSPASAPAEPELEAAAEDDQEGFTAAPSLR